MGYRWGKGEVREGRQSRSAGGARGGREGEVATDGDAARRSLRHWRRTATIVGVAWE